LNYRLPDVLAALGLSQLKRLAEFKQRRQHVFSYYTEALRDVDGLELPSTPSGTDPMWHLFPIRVEAAERRRIFEELRSQGIGVQVNYIPAYWHPVFRDLGYQKGLCPNAESYYAREISLPMFAGLTEPELAAVCDAVRSAVR
jgi:dTDP-4-amino-4,6-dideoxygalactose transaminase